MSRRAPQLGLAELIDLEFALGNLHDWRVSAVAAGEDLCELESLDSAAARARAESDPAWRRQLALAFLQRVRAQGMPLPGNGITTALCALSRLLFGLGLFMGAAALLAAFARQDGAPTNLWAFLAVFVFLQLLLLVALVVGQLSSGRREGRRFSWAQRVVARIATSTSLQKLLGASASDRQFAASLWSKRQSMSGRARAWSLYSAAQSFGVAFHLAASALFLALVLFSDLAFAWSTTPAQLDPDLLTSVVHGLAAPWQWLWPESVPTAEAIRNTQWSRLEHGFVNGGAEAAALASAAWWSFLWMAHLVWGFLPRRIALWWGRRQLQRSLAAQSFDQAEFFELFDAMLPRQSSAWQAPEAATVQGELLPPPQASAPPQAPAPPRDEAARQAQTAHAAREARSAVGLLWGDFPHDATQLTQAFAEGRGWQVASWKVAGGADAAQTLTQLESVLKELEDWSQPAVAIAVEASTTPTKALLRALAQLRAGLPSNAPILLASVDSATPEDLDLWRAFLQRSADPYLRVEALA